MTLSPTTTGDLIAEYQDGDRRTVRYDIRADDALNLALNESAWSHEEYDGCDVVFRTASGDVWVFDYDDSAWVQ
jgi:hypothetical protein